MGFLRGGAFRLFRVSGINVYLHWTWLLVALWAVESGQVDRKTLFLNATIYVTTFVIVLLHEFGHAFACRSVGGLAEQIILWPLGGIAFASPPPRPGAVLWTIAAGPLVNVALVPITVGMLVFAQSAQPESVIAEYLWGVAWINAALLVFNLLPVYPLDGGQIVQSLLWFAVGRANSLRIAGSIGVVIGGAVAVLALFYGNLFGTVMAMFVALQAWNGVRAGNMLKRIESLPRSPGLRCPSCGEAPVMGPFWPCRACGQQYDIFAHYGICPQCGRQETQAPCLFCGRLGPLGAASRADEAVPR